MLERLADGLPLVRFHKDANSFIVQAQLFVSSEGRVETRRRPQRDPAEMTTRLDAATRLIPEQFTGLFEVDNEQSEAIPVFLDCFRRTQQAIALHSHRFESVRCIAIIRVRASHLSIPLRTNVSVLVVDITFVVAVGSGGIMQSLK